MIDTMGEKMKLVIVFSLFLISSASSYATTVEIRGISYTIISCENKPPEARQVRCVKRKISGDWSQLKVCQFPEAQCKMIPTMILNNSPVYAKYRKNPQRVPLNEPDVKTNPLGAICTVDRNSCNSFDACLHQRTAPHGCTTEDLYPLEDGPVQTNRLGKRARI